MAGLAGSIKGRPPGLLLGLSQNSRIAGHPFPSETPFPASPQGSMTRVHVGEDSSPFQSLGSKGGHEAQSKAGLVLGVKARWGSGLEPEGPGFHKGEQSWHLCSGYTVVETAAFLSQHSAIPSQDQGNSGSWWAAPPSPWPAYTSGFESHNSLALPVLIHTKPPAGEPQPTSITARSQQLGLLTLTASSATPLPLPGALSSFGHF